MSRTTMWADKVMFKTTLLIYIFNIKVVLEVQKEHYGIKNRLVQKSSTVRCIIIINTVVRHRP